MPVHQNCGSLHESLSTELHGEIVRHPIVGSRETFESDVETQVELYRPILLRYCQKLTGSKWDAEDLAQDTFLKALPKLADHHENPQALLFRIAKNGWIDQCRKRNHATEYATSAYLNTMQTDPDTAAIIDAMSDLLQQLSPMQRVVLLLRDVFSFSALEVADMIGTTEGAVKSSLHRARKSLDSSREKQQHLPLKTRKEDTASQKAMLNAYLDAFQKSDVQALVMLAQQDVIHPIHALTTLWTTAQKQDTQQAKQNATQQARLHSPFHSTALQLVA